MSKLINQTFMISLKELVCGPTYFDRRLPINQSSRCGRGLYISKTWSSLLTFIAK